jgi:hypothetical protein
MKKTAEKHFKNNGNIPAGFFSMQNSRRTLVKYYPFPKIQKRTPSMLNTTLKLHTLLILLVCGTLFLPACGKKTEVKSQTVSETVLNTPVTPVATVTSQSSADISMPVEKADTSAQADEEQADPTYNSEDSEAMDEVPMTKVAAAPKPAKKSAPEAEKPVAEANVAPAAAEPAMDAAASSTPEALASVPAEESPMDVQTPVKKKSGIMNALLWMIVIPVLLIGLVWFIWSMFHKRELPFQPAPPMGGLSPVSGFTAASNQAKAESESKGSFWNKKLF